MPWANRCGREFFRPSIAGQPWPFGVAPLQLVPQSAAILLHGAPTESAQGHGRHAGQEWRFSRFFS